MIYDDFPVISSHIPCGQTAVSKAYALANESICDILEEVLFMKGCRRHSYIDYYTDGEEERLFLKSSRAATCCHAV